MPVELRANPYEYTSAEWDELLGASTGERVSAVLRPLDAGFPQLKPSTSTLVDDLKSALGNLASEASMDLLSTDLWIANAEQIEATAMFAALVTNQPQQLRLAERMADASLDKILEPVVQQEIAENPNGVAIAAMIQSRFTQMVNWPAVAREAGYGSFEHPSHSVIIRTVKKLATYQATLEALGKPDKAALIVPFMNLCLQGNFPVGVLNGRFLTFTGDEYKQQQRLSATSPRLLEGRRTGNA